MLIGLFLGHKSLCVRPKDHKLVLPWKEMRKGYIKTMFLVRVLIPPKEGGKRYFSLGRGMEVGGVNLNTLESHFNNLGGHFSRKF